MGDYDISKANEVLAFEKKWNLFPAPFIDNKDFEKMRTKMTTKEIEFRKGILHIDVEWINE